MSDANVYSLYFGALKIGVVREEDVDFPNLSGLLEIDQTLSRSVTADAKRMIEFINLNSEYTRLIDVEHEQDVSARLKATNRELESYSDLIDTDDWRLVDNHGIERRILCPIFRDGSEIVWRWNF